MDIIVSARHSNLSDAMKSEAEGRVAQLTQCYNKLTRAEVVMDVKNRNHVEIILHGKGIHLDAKAEGDNLYESISVAVERLEKQLEKKVAKIRDHSGKHLGELEADHLAAAAKEDELVEEY